MGNLKYGPILALVLLIAIFLLYVTNAMVPQYTRMPGDDLLPMLTETTIEKETATHVLCIPGAVKINELSFNRDIDAFERPEYEECFYPEEIIEDIIIESSNSPYYCKDEVLYVENINVSSGGEFILDNCTLLMYNQTPSTRFGGEVENGISVYGDMFINNSIISNADGFYYFTVSENSLFDLRNSHISRIGGVQKSILYSGLHLLAPNVEIDNNVFYDNSASLNIAGENTSITNNSFIGGAYSTFSLLTTTNQPVPYRNITIKSNIFENSSRNYLTNLIDSRIEENGFIGTFENRFNYLNRSIIRNNNFVNSYLYLSVSDDNEITHNNFSSDPSFLSGMWMLGSTNNHITNNYFQYIRRDIQANCIYMTSVLNYRSVNNFISDNEFNGCDIGLALNQVNDTVVEENIFINNSVAFNLSTTNNNEIKNNNVCYNEETFSLFDSEDIVDENEFCVDITDQRNENSFIEFEVSNLFGTTSCQLYENGTFVAENTNVSDGETQIIEYSVLIDEEYYMYCNDSLGTNYGSTSWVGGLLTSGEVCSVDNECQSGYCVHGICRESNIHCGDSYCDSGETCESCETDCGACSSSPGGSGGGGGGGSIGSYRTETDPVEEIPPAEIVEPETELEVSELEEEREQEYPTYLYYSLLLILLLGSIWYIFENYKIKGKYKAKINKWKKKLKIKK